MCVVAEKKNNYITIADSNFLTESAYAAVSLSRLLPLRFNKSTCMVENLSRLIIQVQWEHLYISEFIKTFITIQVQVQYLYSSEFIKTYHSGSVRASVQEWVYENHYHLHSMRASFLISEMITKSLQPCTEGLYVQEYFVKQNFISW